MAVGEPLAGVKVVDLSRLLPGPYCTQLLADMGADVIKVEDYKSGGDGTRLYPPHTADGGSAMYHVLNRGKKSVGVHLRSEEGVAAIRVRWAPPPCAAHTTRHPLPTTRHPRHPYHPPTTNH